MIFIFYIKYNINVFKKILYKMQKIKKNIKIIKNYFLNIFLIVIQFFFFFYNNFLTNK